MITILFAASLNVVAINFINGVKNLFQYFIIDFLPGGEAYRNFDSYAHGFFVWTILLSLVITGFVLYFVNKVQNLAFKYSVLKKCRKNAATPLFIYKVQEKKQREQDALEWENKLIEVEEIIARGE